MSYFDVLDIAKELKYKNYAANPRPVVPLWLELNTHRDYYYNA